MIENKEIICLIRRQRRSLTGNESKSLNSFKVSMFDRHNPDVGKQLFRIVVNQLSANQINVTFKKNKNKPF